MNKINNHHLEAALEGYFRSVVRRALGGIVVKLAPTQKGVPDRMVLLPGGAIRLVELKQEHGVVSPIQKVWHSRARELGVKVDVLFGKEDVDFWVRSVIEED